MTDPFPYIKVSGSAHECGLKHGKAAKKQIHHNIDYYLGIWSRICGMTRNDALKKASTTADPIKKYDSGIFEEKGGHREGLELKARLHTSIKHEIRASLQSG